MFRKKVSLDVAVGHKPDPVSYTSHLHWPLAHAVAKTVGRDHTRTVTLEEWG